MALTIKHLNTDASFQVTFTPNTRGASCAAPPRPFHILLDPWITGPAKILHAKLSLTRHIHPACITALTQLPVPDLVVISQAKADHCHEATLRQLPRDGPTLILADPAAARTIRGWRHFDPRKVRALRRYGGGDGSGSGDDTAVARFPLKDGEGGEVSVAWIPQRHDLTGLHAAVGITFRPPATMESDWENEDNEDEDSEDDADAELQRPISPASTLRSARSASTLTTMTPTLTNASTLAAAPISSSSSSSTQRTLSLLFSPHGMPFAGPLSSYATTHLVREAALPLTALLHCFDSVRNPWWLGGAVLLGAPAGREIALRLGAQVWVSCHDGAKEVRGLATGWLRTRRWGLEDVQRVVCERREREREEAERLRTRTRREVKRKNKGSGVGRPVTASPEIAPPAQRMTRSRYSAMGKDGRTGTQVLDLASGEEVFLTSEGVWNGAVAPLGLSLSVAVESKMAMRAF